MSVSYVPGYFFLIESNNDLFACVKGHPGFDSIKMRPTVQSHISMPCASQKLAWFYLFLKHLSPAGTG